MAAFGWSIGDIIAAINIVIVSINAVKESTGAAAEYRAVAGTLAQLASTLEDLNKLEIQDGAERRALEAPARKCGETLHQFVSKISKFKPALGLHHPVWKPGATLRKIQWALCNKEDLRRFQTQLLADLAIMNVTLVRFQTSLSITQAAETQSALIRVERNLNHNNAVHLLLFQALACCFSEFRGFLVFLLVGHMRIINFLVSSPQISQAPVETPIYLDDPNRRVLIFLRSWIRDWEDFETLLKMQFKREAGLQKIKAREYTLHDPVRSADITHAMPVERVFLPGRKLYMSIVFLVTRTFSHCPRCSGTPSKTDGFEMQCDSCKLSFSKERITELEEEEEEEEEEYAKPEMVPSPETSFGKDRPLLQKISDTNSMLDPEDSIHDFTRVRIVEKTGTKRPSLEKIKESPTPLLSAAQHGHVAVVKLLLETGRVDVNSKDQDGRTPLCLAAENGYVAVVELLLGTDLVDVDSKNNYGHTPLFGAAKNGHEDIVKLLLETGRVDVNSMDKYNRTPLSGAATNGHKAIVKLLGSNAYASWSSARSQSLFSQHDGMSIPIPSSDWSDTHSYEELNSGNPSHQGSLDVQLSSHSNGSYNTSVDGRRQWEADGVHHQQNNTELNSLHQSSDVMFTGGFDGYGSTDVLSEYSAMNLNGTEFEDQSYQNLQISSHSPDSDFITRNSPFPSFLSSPEPEFQYQNETHNSIQEQSIEIIMGLVHSKNVNSWVNCDICGKLVSEKGFTRHRKRMHQNEEARPTEKFTCSYPSCASWFNTPKDLARHYRIHTGLKPYSCEKCAKAFSRKDSLERHMRVHREHYEGESGGSLDNVPFPFVSAVAV